MTCPLCGAPDADGSARCPQCGWAGPGAAPEVESLPLYGESGAAITAPEPADAPDPGRRNRLPLIVGAAVVGVLLSVAATGALTRRDVARGELLDVGLAFELPSGVDDEPHVAWREPFEATRLVSVGGILVAAEEDSGDVVGFAADDGEERWRVEPERRDDRVGWLSPLGDDRVLVSYTPHGEGGGEARLAAVAGRDGEVRWRYSRQGAVVGFPLDDDHVSVYGSRGPEGEFNLSVLSGQDGSIAWAVEGNPTVVGDGTVYVHRRDELVAFDLATGDERWTRDVRGDLDQINNSGAEVGDTVVVGRDENTIVGLSRSDGDFLWSRSLGAPIRAVRSTGEAVVASGEETAFGVDPEDGAVLWTVETADWWSGPTLRINGDPGIYSIDRGVIRLDPTTGKRLAQSPTAEPSGRTPLSESTFADGVLYLASDEEVFGVDSTSLKRLWSVDVGVDFFELAAVDGAVIVATSDELIAYRE